MVVTEMSGTVDPETLELLKSKTREGVRWAAYRNIEPNSSNYGHTQFLMVGADCTYADPPDQYPKDTEWGLAWRYRFAGYVDLETGKIER